MLDSGFSPWPSFSEEEIEAVSKVLASGRVNYWTGSECAEFEKEFAALTETRYAIAVANGTVALELALKAMGIGAGDEVIVPPRTFIATASSVINVGAVPVFADIDRDSQNLTAETVASVISPRTKAIVCVHLAGWPCDMDAIMALAEDRGLLVVEDCAQAHGARYRGRSVGGLGHIAAWSFCQDKIITTGGEGGMVTTNNEQLANLVWSLKDHGKTPMLRDAPGQIKSRWVHERVGTNARLTEMQAAIGRIQLRKLPSWTAARERNAVKILSGLQDLTACRAPLPPSGYGHAWYKAYFFVDLEALGAGWDRDRVRREIVDSGVPCYEGICPEVYRERAFGSVFPRGHETLINASVLGETSLMVLVHPSLTDAEVVKTRDVLRDVLGRAGRR